MTESEIEAMIQRKASEMFGQPLPKPIADHCIAKIHNSAYAHFGICSIYEHQVGETIREFLCTIQMGYNWHGGIIK